MSHWLNSCCLMPKTPSCDIPPQAGVPPPHLVADMRIWLSPTHSIILTRTWANKSSTRWCYQASFASRLSPGALRKPGARPPTSGKIHILKRKKPGAGPDCHGTPPWWWWVSMSWSDSRLQAWQFPTDDVINRVRYSGETRSRRRREETCCCCRRSVNVKTRRRWFIRVEGIFICHWKVLAPHL